MYKIERKPLTFAKQMKIFERKDVVEIKNDKTQKNGFPISNYCTFYSYITKEEVLLNTSFQINNCPLLQHFCKISIKEIENTMSKIDTCVEKIQEKFHADYVIILDVEDNKLSVMLKKQNKSWLQLGINIETHETTIKDYFFYQTLLINHFSDLTDDVVFKIFSSDSNDLYYDAETIHPDLLKMYQYIIEFKGPQSSVIIKDKKNNVFEVTSNKALFMITFVDDTIHGKEIMPVNKYVVISRNIQVSYDSIRACRPFYNENNYEIYIYSSKLCIDNNDYTVVTNDKCYYKVILEQKENDISKYIGVYAYSLQEKKLFSSKIIEFFDEDSVVKTFRTQNEYETIYTPDRKRVEIFKSKLIPYWQKKHCYIDNENTIVFNGIIWNYFKLNNKNIIYIQDFKENRELFYILNRKDPLSKDKLFIDFEYKDVSKKEFCENIENYVREKIEQYKNKFEEDTKIYETLFLFL